MGWIINEIFQGFPFGGEVREVMDVEYEDLTPPREIEETYEDYTSGGPGKP